MGIRGIGISERIAIIHNPPIFDYRFPGEPEKKFTIRPLNTRPGYLSGSEGHVFHIQRQDDRKDFYLKIFNEQVLSKEAHIRRIRTDYLCGLRLHSVPVKSAEWTFAGAPRALIIKNFGFPDPPFMGVIMEIAMGKVWEWMKKDRSTTIDQKTRLELVRQLMIAARILENHQIAHCDISPSNVLISLGDVQLSLVDFDLFWSSKTKELNEHGKDPGPGHLNYIAPKGTNQMGSYYDRFALSILAYEVLAWDSWGEDYPMISQESINLFSVRVDPLVEQRYSAGTKKLIERALQAQKPKERPSPGEWLDELSKLAPSPVRRVIALEWDRKLNRYTTIGEVVSADLLKKKYGTRIRVNWKWSGDEFVVQLAQESDFAKCHLRNMKGEPTGLNTNDWTPVYAGYTLWESRIYLRFMGGS